MATPSVLLLHGYEHERPRDHWPWWLHDELGAHGVTVRYPQLPRPLAPRLDEWLEAGNSELAALAGGALTEHADHPRAIPRAAGQPAAAHAPERVVVTHSLGGILWHHLAAGGARVDRVLIVAPPSHERLTEHLASFSLAPIDESATGAVVPTTVLARERDPYRATPVAHLASAWGAAHVTLPGEGHLNPDDGHGPLAPALEWVLTGEVRQPTADA